MPDKAAIPRSTDGMVDIQSLLRLLAEQVVNAIMDEEADQLCRDGANSRNGYRNRTLETCVGTLNLRILKLRTGSFFPEDVLERYRRVVREANEWFRQIGPQRGPGIKAAVIRFER